MKAPVSFSLSHGAVVSQARSRTIALLSRTDCPGFTRTSRVMPLRLLRMPRTATRSAIGVTPTCFPGPALVLGKATVFDCSFASWRPHPAAMSSISDRPVAASAFTLSRGSTADNRR